MARPREEELASKRGYNTLAGQGAMAMDNKPPNQIEDLQGQVAYLNDKIKELEEELLQVYRKVHKAYSY